MSRKKVKCGGRQREKKMDHVALAPMVPEAILVGRGDLGQGCVVDRGAVCTLFFFFLPEEARSGEGPGARSCLGVGAVV